MIQVSYQKRGNIWYGAAVRDNRVVATAFSDEESDLRHLLKILPKDVPFQVVAEPDKTLTNVLNMLEDVFNGNDQKIHDNKIDIDQLTGYTQKVLNCTRLVPVGYVTTYGTIAKAVGGSPRSVGNVQATNPVPLLIPCHRVVCSDFTVGGYGGGKQVKMDILKREERGYEESTELDMDNKKLVLFPTKWVKQ